MSKHLMFDDWLLSTRTLQRQSFGADPATLPVDQLEFYLRYNFMALVKELGEAFDEFDWKPWTTTHDGFTNRDAFVNELVDVLHFAANMLVAAGCDDTELSERYAAKQQKNRDRMATPGGFTGVKEKCPSCGRNYDEDTTPCAPGRTLIADDGSSGGTIPPYCAYEPEWETAVLGSNIYVKTAVRVKPDAYAQVLRSAILNGTTGTVSDIRHGKCEVRHDGGSLFMHEPDKLEVRKPLPGEPVPGTMQSHGPRT